MAMKSHSNNKKYAWNPESEPLQCMLMIPVPALLQSNKTSGAILIISTGSAFFDRKVKVSIGNHKIISGWIPHPCRLVTVHVGYNTKPVTEQNSEAELHKCFREDSTFLLSIRTT